MTDTDGGLLSRVYLASADPRTTPGDLLRRYIRDGDSASFALLVRVLGPTVLGVCKRKLGDTPDADDAFQAAFVVLFRKARSIRDPDRLTSWIYGVALRTSDRVKRTRVKRMRETPMEHDVASSDAPGVEPDLKDVVDDEIARLPEQFRLPVLLCGARELSHEDAARELGCPVGTLASRLSRGKAILRDRLIRRGLALPSSGAFFLGISTESLLATPRLALLESLWKSILAGESSPAIEPIARGVIAEMSHTKQLTVVALASALIMATGISIWAGQDKPEQKSPPKPASGPPVVVNAKESAPGLKAVQDGNRRFAFDAYARIREQPGNVVISPISLSSAMALASLGMAGDTEKQVLSTLRLPERDVLHPAYARLRKAMVPAEKNGFQLKAANVLFGQQGHPWNEEYLKEAQKWHESGLIQVDYANSQAARKTINDWIESKTEKMIRDALPEDAIQPGTIMNLVNAVYFKGSWQYEFNPYLTKDRPFHTAKGPVKVPMMEMTSLAYLEHTQTKDAHVVALPYRNGDKGINDEKAPETVMVLVLPKAKDGLAAIEKKLDAALLESWEKKMEIAAVQPRLPKFKFGKAVDWTKQMQEMGAADAFDQSRADFSRMTTQSLWLNRVLQKTEIEVNETGTVASAATIVGGLGGGAPEVVKLVFDRPFLFLIKHQPTGTILFMGRYAGPG